jgi:uncharacterized RDD family membrane protein YckC
MSEEVEALCMRENISLSPFSKRALAAVLDEVLLAVLLLFSIWGNLQSLQNINDQIMMINTFVFEFLIVKILYQTFFVTTYGATPGKMVMKIRIIEINSVASPTLISALNRGIFRVISEMIMYIGFLWGFLDENRQTWHDKSSKTLVINA